jgi:hypothetical protein
MQRLFVALHGTMGSYLSDASQEDALLMLRHAFLFLGLSFFLFYSFFFVVSADFSCKNICT